MRQHSRYVPDYVLEALRANGYKVTISGDNGSDYIEIENGIRRIAFYFFFPIGDPANIESMKRDHEEMLSELKMWANV